jgi:hypothetical protein
MQAFRRRRFGSHYGAQGGPATTVDRRVPDRKNASVNRHTNQEKWYAILPERPGSIRPC